MLLDIGLPGMSGYDAARQLRAEPDLKDVAIIALTGFGGEADIRRAREAGFDDLAVKPVQPRTAQGADSTEEGGKFGGRAVTASHPFRSTSSRQAIARP